PVGDLTLKPEFHGAVAGVLARGNARFDELLALPPFGPDGDGLLLDCLALLVHSRQALVLAGHGDVDVRPAQRFNRVIVDRARAGRPYGHLASPIAGPGIPVDEIGLLALAALFDGQAAEPAGLARHVLSNFAAVGRSPLRDNKNIVDNE